ncbi:hypothetical protein A9320_11650 [Ruegeria sp. PBVC088]|nr:hypothetical protein A9320_11650 [Ruegeria sp. PBVC088]
MPRPFPAAFSGCIAAKAIRSTEYPHFYQLLQKRALMAALSGLRTLMSLCVTSCASFQIWTQHSWTSSPQNVLLFQRRPAFQANGAIRLFG